jgi:L-asparaginase
MTLSPGPPPWPIPPSWTLTPPPPRARRERAPEPAVAHRMIALLAPDDAEARDVLGAVPGVTVDARSIRPPSPGFAGVYELADAAARALSEGADGVVVVLGADAPEETAWALDLLHPGDAPLVLAAGPDRAGDVADAVRVAAEAPARSGCLLVARGEIHAARYARRTDARTLASPGAGPVGHVTAGAVRLLWRPPERLTVRTGATGGRRPRVGLHTAVLGDDGLLLSALAERCDGLVVSAAAAAGVPEEIAAVLAEASARIPVVLASPAGHDGIPVTTLDPLKARVLMHLLLAAGRDRDAVLAAFTAAERPGPAQL